VRKARQAILTRTREDIDTSTHDLVSVREVELVSM
jgi:hypothetical protein